jgi:hypothetical protein
MSFTQSIETARAERIGAEGAAAAAFDDALKHSNQALDWLRARHADGSLPLLRLPAARNAARLLGVDAFDQPAVEEGKVLAKRYLTGG